MTISSGTVTIQATGGSPNYTSWTGFEADIVDLTGQLIGEATAIEEISGLVTFSGWSTTAANDLIIRAASGIEHKGIRGAGHRIYANNSGGFGTLQFAAGVMHYTVRDLEIIQDGADSHTFRQTASTVSVNGDILIDRCLVYSSRTSDDQTISKVFNQEGTWSHFDVAEFRNVLGVGFGSTAMQGDSGSTTRVLANYCVLVNDVTDSDVSRGGIRYCLAKNCAVFHFGDDGGSGWFDYMNLGTGSANNASHDSSGDSGLTGLTIGDEFVDVTASAWDFHLKSGSTLESAGADISGITVDVDGDTRDGSTPDVGFDELVAGVIITDVDGDEAWNDGDSGLVITGTGFV